mgnify:CR=1 FL=1
MLFSFQKTLLILLLGFAFIGQSLASSVMAYRMMSMNEMTMSMPSEVMSAQENNQTMSDHCAEQMKSSTKNDNTANKCCEQQCNCFVNGCSTAIGLTAFINAEPIVLNSIKIHSLLSPLTSQQLTSLYRPPIFA